MARSVFLRRALSPTFPAGELVFFIPWRVVALQFRRGAISSLPGPPWWWSGRWPHDGDVAGGAVFRFRDIAVGGDDGSSGDRSDRRCGGGTGSPAPTARLERRID